MVSTDKVDGTDESMTQPKKSTKKNSTQKNHLKKFYKKITTQLLAIVIPMFFLMLPSLWDGS